MLQLENPQDLVISSNETHTVREFVEISFKYIGIDLKWMGSGEDEIGYNPVDNKILVKVNPKYYRPLEVPFLRGDSKKARELLNWEPEISFTKLVNIMMEHDLQN